MVKFFDRPIVQLPFTWLAEIGSDRSLLGMNAESEWCMKIRDEIVVFRSEQNCMMLLPLLEVERSVFFDALNMLGPESRTAAAEGFPEHQLLLFAFRYVGSEYWAEKAFAWLSQNKQLTLRMTADLDDLVKGKKFSQRLTHRVIKLLPRPPSE